MLQIKQTRGRRMSRSSSKYHPVLRVIRNTFIAVFVLVGLLVGGAFAYTWYNSQSSETRVICESASGLLVVRSEAQ